MRVLIVEDNLEIARQIKTVLLEHGYAVDLALDGREGKFLGETEPYDAVILDLGLPQLDGLSVLRQWRQSGRTMPVLILTARDAWTDKVDGLNAGADDYLVKPFALKEVEARLVAMHKRHGGKVTSRILESDDLSFDPKTLSVRFAGAAVKLPPKCIRLLALMMGEPGRVFSRRELESEVWGDAQGTSDTLRSHMHELRRALTRAGGYDPIETVHGLGYRLISRAGV